jgi:hypothetical protein
MDEQPAQPQWDTEATPPSGQPVSAHPAIEPIRWSASEFISHQKTSSWYVVFGMGAGVLTFLVIYITSSIMSGLVVAMASVALAVFAARKPETKQYELNDSGIMIGGNAYPYEQFKSFSVVEEGALESIWLRPLKRYMPTMVIYFAPEDEQRIVDMLENFLPEETRALDTIDKISRRIRF